MNYKNKVWTLSTWKSVSRTLTFRLVWRKLLRLPTTGISHITLTLWDPELRREIAAFYQREYGVTVDPDCIVVTSGSSPSILLVLMLLCNSDSEVILSNPGYACYRNFVLAAQAKPVLVPLSEENGLQYDIEAIRKCVTPHTAGIFINSPMNPTGIFAG